MEVRKRTVPFVYLFVSDSKKTTFFLASFENNVYLCIGTPADGPNRTGSGGLLHVLLFLKRG